MAIAGACARKPPMTAKNISGSNILGQIISEQNIPGQSASSATQVSDAAPDQPPAGQALAAAGADRLSLRIASAAVLGPSAIGVTILGGPVFAAAVAFALVVMCFEWTRMVERREASLSFYAMALGGAGAVSGAAAGFFGAAFLTCAAGAAAAVALSWGRPAAWPWLAFGAVYVLAPSVALIWIREALEDGRNLALLLFLVVWSADTGGYVGGRLVGGPKLNVALSPAKTWAGAVGGVIFGSAAGAIAASALFGSEQSGRFALIGASLGLVSILGDMTESAFKRNFGVKDTSGFIPGHGGALDRLDGMIFATTAMALAIWVQTLAFWS